VPRPKLEKNLHVNYLGKNLFQLPGAFVSLDASRQWMVYWILHSLDVLGIALDDGTKARCVPTSGCRGLASRPLAFACARG
jgi:protein farnesyltransferase subunit beta